MSGPCNMLKEDYKADTQQLIRLAIKDEIDWSEKAQKSRQAFKDKMLEDNHTTRPHNMRRNARDTDHDWITNTYVPYYNPLFLIDLSNETPWYA